jgi:hypothetical protein
MKGSVRANVTLVGDVLTGGTRFDNKAGPQYGSSEHAVLKRVANSGSPPRALTLQHLRHFYALRRHDESEAVSTLRAIVRCVDGLTGWSRCVPAAFFCNEHLAGQENCVELNSFGSIEP